MPPKAKKKFSDVQIRALMLQEYQVGRTSLQAARNICRQTEESVTTPSTVKKWFARFASGDTNLGNKNWKRVKIPNLDECFLPVNKSLWFEVADPRLWFNFSTLDGRVGISTSRKHKESFTVHLSDLLYGKVTDLPVKIDISHAQILNSCYCVLLDFDKLLIYDHVYVRKGCRRVTEFFLLRIDYDELKCEIVDRIQVEGNSVVKFVDQQSKSFVLCPYWFYPQVGSRLVSFRNNRLQVGDDVPEIPNLECTKRVGQMIYGLRWHPNSRQLNIGQYCEFDMMSGELIKGVDVQMVADGEVPTNVHLDKDFLYSWNGDRLFLANSSPAGTSFFSLDTVTQVWTKVNVRVGERLRFLFADSDDCLVVATRELERKADKICVHHFSLKKPDSLRNLAFANLRFRSNFFKSDLYGKIIDRLPYNCDLRELFVKEAEEEIGDDEQVDESQ